MITSALLFAVLFGAVLGFLVRLVLDRRLAGRDRLANAFLGALFGAAMGVILGAVDLFVFHGAAAQELPGVVLTFGSVAIVGAIAIRATAALIRNGDGLRPVPVIRLTALVLATVLAMMLVNLVGALGAVATLPILDLINRGPNQLVLAVTLALEAGAILLAMLVLQWAGGRMDSARPLFDMAGYACLIFLIQTVVSFLVSETRSFFEIQLRTSHSST
jgi:hypothetical protein